MINDWLSEHKEQIKQGKIKVFVEDECHLKGGDICGWGWSDRKLRLEIKVKNDRDSQTDYGAINCVTGEIFLRSYLTRHLGIMISRQTLLRLVMMSRLRKRWCG